jgi:iron(III) transport system permease protein
VVILVFAVIGLFAQQRFSGPREQYETIGGREASTETFRHDLGKYKYPLSAVVALIALFVYIIPLITIFISSFQQTFLGFDFTYVRWTTENYESLFWGTRSDIFFRSLTNSLLISGFGALGGMIIASLASYIIVKSDSPLGEVLNIITLSPGAMPGIIVATAFLWIFLTYNFLGLYGTIWIIMLALTARFIVYGSRASNSAFRSIGDELEEAAQISGAGIFTIFREVYLPLIKPGFAAGYILLFIDYMKVLSIPLLLQGANNDVMATLIWSAERDGKPEVAASVAIILILIILIIYGSLYLFTDIEVTKL